MKRLMLLTLFTLLYTNPLHAARLYNLSYEEFYYDGGRSCTVLASGNTYAGCLVETSQGNQFVPPPQCYEPGVCPSHPILESACQICETMAYRQAS